MQKGIVVTLMVVLSVICSVAYAEGVDGVAKNCFAQEYDMSELVNLTENTRIRELIAQYMLCSGIETGVCEFSDIPGCLEGECASNSVQTFSSVCQDIHDNLTKRIFPVLRGDPVSPDICKPSKDSMLRFDSQEIDENYRECSSLLNAVQDNDCSPLLGKKSFEACQAFLAKDIMPIITYVFDGSINNHITGWVLYRDVPQIYRGEQNVCKRIYNTIKKEYCSESNKQENLVIKE